MNRPLTKKSAGAIDWPTFLNVLSVSSTIVTSAIAWAHPFSNDPATHAPATQIVAMTPWILVQSMLLVVIGWAIGRMGCRLRWRWLAAVGCVGILLVPTIVLCDVVTFGWMHERFLSMQTLRVASELMQGLGRHAGSGTLRGGAVLLIGWGLGVSIMLSVSRWAAMQTTLHGDTWLQRLVLGCLILSISSVVPLDRCLASMQVDSSRHPLCVFCIVGHHDSGPKNVSFAKLVVETDLRSAITKRQHQHRQLNADGIAKSPPDVLFADVLLVVIESMRHELVCEEVMPNLTKFASRGIHCRQHFSGGNATNHGMFSLLSGLEAIWYESDVRVSPLLNRLMHQAGYELGFFAGHDDWQIFKMDGYISPEHYDVFEIGKQRGLESDRIATRRAANFLDRHDLRGSDEAPSPRLAILYLYATHADYHSYPQDQVFQPAADDRFLIPFTSAMKDEVWNRYLNSARTVDRFLSAVMRDDRVVIVTGDHGESFLEDGACGHGIRISRFQNMTPAVIYCPGRSARRIDIPTTHADLLPTLLSAIGVKLNDQETLDGIELDFANESILRKRLFTTRNYLNDDVAVIVPSDDIDAGVFGYRGTFSIRDAIALPINPIDERGQQVLQNPDQTSKWWSQWLKSRMNAE